MSAHSTCLSPFCGTRVSNWAVRCPDCGRQIYCDGEIKRRGWHVLQLGIVLVALMCGILWFWSPGFLNAIQGAPRTSFIGTSRQAWLTLFALGAIGLGGIAVAATACMMIFGRPSRFTTIIAIALLGLGFSFVAALLVSAYGP